MMPNIPSVASRHASPNHQNSRPSSSSQDLRQHTELPIPMAQECTEVPGLLAGFTYVHNHFDEPNSRCVDGEPSEPVVQSNKLTNVKLTKSQSPPNESSRFFVLPAGGMSISVPELPPEHSITERNLKTNFSSHPITQTEDRSSARYNGPPIIPTAKTQGSSYLPLSMELIAGRGQSSVPSNGNKNTSSTKVRSLPPSHTLAKSASIIKSYFISGPEKQQSKSAGSTPDTETSVKTKMMGLWNNVKYGWTVNLKTNFSRDSPVYLLGSVYHKCFGEDGDSSAEEVEKNGMEAFKRHFHSLVWCTYRRQFPTLEDSTLTTDCGWGCMLRTGQMMLAHSLVRHFLTREWRYNKNALDAPEELIHRSIVQWFGDSPLPQCPLSLHKLVQFGHRLGKKAGDWYGPASVAYIFKEAVEMGSKCIPDLKKICVYVAQDCAVYIQDVLDMCFTTCLCNTGNLTLLGKDFDRKERPKMYQEESEPQTMDPIFPETFRTAPNACVQNGKNKQMNEEPCHVLGGMNQMGKDVRLDSEIMKDGKSLINFYKENERHGVDHQIPSVDISVRSCNDWKMSVNVNQERQDRLDGSPPILPCSKCDNWRSVLIMVPVRLGGEALNPIYAPCLYSLFTHDLCVGIIGGRPKHSLYFVGFQEDSLIHLDPHLCQDAVMVTQQNFPVSSYHCSSPRKMALSRMDPSATLGFYCHSRTDFLRLMEELPELVTPKQPGFEYPIFEFLDGRCEDTDACTRQVSTEDEMAASLPVDTPLLPQDSEEFVFL